VQVGVGKRRIASVCHHFFSVRLEVLKPWPTVHDDPWSVTISSSVAAEDSSRK
jgi:hypothetical protein